MPGHRDLSWEPDGPTGADEDPRPPWRPDAFAVIIGIDIYRDPQIPDLRYARKDAEAIYQVLTDPAVGRIHPDNVITLLDADATERSIRSALGTKLPRRSSEHSTICIYYAGHGAPVIDTDARRHSADSIEKCLVPHDADADDLQASAISMDAIQQYFSRLDARQVVCFFDTCYSGAAGGRSFERDSFRTRTATLSDEQFDRLAGEGRVIMTACEKNEVSLESVEKGHGVFTYYLVRGLRGEADRDQDGRVTVDELYDYVYHHVGREARSMGGRMRPLRKGSVRGRVYLTEYRQGGAASSVDPAPERSNDADTATASATAGRRRKWQAAIVAASSISLLAVLLWAWNASRSPATTPAPETPAAPRANEVTAGPADAPDSGDGTRPAGATGQVVLEWSGSSDVGWSVVDRANTTLVEGFAPARGTSRVNVQPGNFFVVVKDLPGSPRLPVTVVAGQSTTVTPPLGHLEVTWSGTTAITVTLEDQDRRVLRRNWQIPASGSGTVDLGPGRYSIVPANAARRAVTVLASNTVVLKLEPDPVPSSPGARASAPPAPGPTPAAVASPPAPSDPAPRRAVLPYQPGQWKLPTGDNLGFVLIEEGSFPMGSDPDRHRGALYDERPQRAVRLPAFFMGRYEVTVDQYKACVDEGGCKPANARALQGPVDRPVRFISWDEAVEYCTWLDGRLRSWSATPGPLATVLRGVPVWKVRLPSEAEWEKAARGTTNQIYPWGDTIDASHANYKNRIKEPTTVGIYPDGASPYGLLDMSGNVWEWTRSRLLRYPYNPNDDREDTRPSKDTRRVIRGGSFQTEDPWAARRNTGERTDRTDFIGFRVAIGPPQ